MPRPDPATADAQGDSYRFERPATWRDGTRGCIDLYRAGQLVMEAKQGTKGAKPDPEAQLLPSVFRKGHGQPGSRARDDTMVCARNQTGACARAVPRAYGSPPVQLIVGAGHVFDVYADFSGQGQGYTQFPHGNRYRFWLDDLRTESTRDAVLTWTSRQPRLNLAGKPVTRWEGETTLRPPLTEIRSLVRWLRPDYQNPRAAPPRPAKPPPRPSGPNPCPNNSPPSAPPC